MTFVIGSYRAVEHPGGGHRASAWPLWRGEDLRTVDEVAMTVLPVDCAADAALTVESVRQVQHDHLLPVTDVVEDERRVVLVCAWPRGGRLLELLTRRGRLSVGETLTVLVPLAAALAAVHGAGERHGGVCPEGIWFDAHGRPMLGALAVARTVADHNDGLPAVSRDVAPEVVRGEVHGGSPVTSAADVFALGSVALRCLTGRSAWPADDPVDVLVQSAAGLWPDLSDDAGPPELVRLIRTMLSADPAERPAAVNVLGQLAGAGEAAPIRFESGPTPTPAATTRWRGWAEQADATELTEVGEVDPPAGRGGPRAGRGGPRAGRGGIGPGEPPDARRRPTPMARAGIALLSGLLIALVAVQLAGWWSGWDSPQAAPGAPRPDAAAQVEAPDWPAVVAGLDAARGAAFAAADPALLAEVYLDGSAARQSDAVAVGRLAAQGWRVQGGVHEISSVTVDGESDPAGGTVTGGGAADHGAEGGLVRLAVVDSLPSHPIVDADGRQVGVTPARAEQRRILVVTRAAAGYRISDVAPG